jgi:hypothetical protein
MALELVHTSATHGLRPGSSGFCTVAATRDLPPSLVPRLEALAGYRPGPSGRGPVSLAFLRLESAGQPLYVLARVAPAPPDHTGRSNKLASFLVLGEQELPAAGPAWTLAQPGLLRTEWRGEPSFIDRRPEVPPGAAPGPRPASAWAAAAGDAGWAGVVASAFLREQQRPIHVVLPESVDALPLVDEVIALLPPWARWRMTFTTYFMQSVAGAPCCLRFCVDGTPAAAAARQAGGLVVDCTQALPPPRDSRFVRMARSGVHEAEEVGLCADVGPGAPSAPGQSAAAGGEARAAAGDAEGLREALHAQGAAASDGLPARMGPRTLALVALGVMAVVVTGMFILFRGHAGATTPATVRGASRAPVEHCSLVLGRPLTVGVPEGALAVRLLGVDGAPLAEGFALPTEAVVMPAVRAVPGAMLELRRESPDRVTLLARRATDAELDAATGGAAAAVRAGGPAPDGWCVVLLAADGSELVRADVVTPEGRP